jgi:hypothetical protein
MTEDEVNAKLDAVHAGERNRLDAIGSHVAALSEETSTLISQANAQMVDDETPYGLLVQQLVKGTTAYADKGNIEPLRGVLEHITGVDLGRYLHDARGAGATKRLTPIKAAVRDVRIVRSWPRPHPIGDKLLKIVAKRHGVAVEQIRSRLGE